MVPNAACYKYVHRARAQRYGMILYIEDSWTVSPLSLLTYCRGQYFYWKVGGDEGGSQNLSSQSIGKVSVRI